MRILLRQGVLYSAGLVVLDIPEVPEMLEFLLLRAAAVDQFLMVEPDYRLLVTVAN